MIGSMRPAGLGVPDRGTKNEYGQKKEDARNFKPQLAADATERPQETTHAASQAARSQAGSAARLPSNGGPIHTLNGRRTPRRLGADACALLGAPRQPLPGHAPCNTHADPQYPADGLRFHSRL